MSPGKELARRIGAQKFGLGRDADAPQVKPIGVPAVLKGDIPFGQSVGMQPARFKQQVKIGVIEMNQLAAQRPGVFRPAVTVTEVVNSFTRRES